MVFGEPDIDVREVGDGQVTVEVGVKVINHYGAEVMKVFGV